MFLLYKALLVTAAYLPPQFDTSSSVLLDPKSRLEWLARKFLTWDSVYYISSAHRGLTFEHEYAFSPIWSSIIRLASPYNTIVSLALTAVTIALVCSWITGFFFGRLGSIAGLNESSRKLAQKLYIFSPAGIFLIAGYPESLFACLSAVGLWLFYRRSYALSGALFGLTCLLRSNGLLWGILFAWKVLQSKRKGQLFIGGSLIGALFLMPQIRLYRDMCPGSEWCNDTIPLGYTYIQSKYWNNGFLKYWTPNNIPNFLFALPTLILLVRSLKVLPTELKLVQVIYIVGAVAFWHVQIITRVASCLPGPYLYVAKTDNLETRFWKGYFIVWSLTQAVLFGAFMPPA